mmetsp:Transcript_22123/g.61409  ORF Transcript_22123/g.61409 Transcript_22123/m.61409 type:complete len:207 (-) Transcript_22123:127-747(-)
MSSLYLTLPGSCSASKSSSCAARSMRSSHSSVPTLSIQSSFTPNSSTKLELGFLGPIRSFSSSVVCQCGLTANQVDGLCFLLKYVVSLKLNMYMAVIIRISMTIARKMKLFLLLVAGGALSVVSSSAKCHSGAPPFLEVFRSVSTILLVSWLVSWGSPFLCQRDACLSALSRRLRPQERLLLNSPTRPPSRSPLQPSRLLTSLNST